MYNQNEKRMVNKSLIKEATAQLFISFLAQKEINKRLIEILEEVQDKLENGIPCPKRLEMEFEQLSHELNRCVSKQFHAEIIIGFYWGKKNVLN